MTVKRPQMSLVSSMSERNTYDEFYMSEADLIEIARRYVAESYGIPRTRVQVDVSLRSDTAVVFRVKPDPTK